MLCFDVIIQVTGNGRVNVTLTVSVVILLVLLCNFSAIAL